jgi:hypothetical protein
MTDRAMTIEAIIEEIRLLPVAERKRLISAIVDTLTESEAQVTDKQRRILDFEGIAAHLADNEDPQVYINRLRNEWDNRP